MNPLKHIKKIIHFLKESLNLIDEAQERVMEINTRVPSEHFKFMMFRELTAGFTAIYLIRKTNYLMIIDGEEDVFIFKAESNEPWNTDNLVGSSYLDIAYINDECYERLINSLKKIYSLENATRSDLGYQFSTKTKLSSSGFGTKSYFIFELRGEEMMELLPKGAVKYLCYHLDKL